MQQSPLVTYFQARKINFLEVGPGITTPRYFSDPKQEHLATRSAAGLFDFSFMACFRISGYGATAFLQRLQTRDIKNLATGRIAYTLLCRNDGSVLNDATVWRLDAESYWLFTGCRANSAHLIDVARDFSVELHDLSDQIAVIALQGDNSLEIFKKNIDHKAVSSLPYYGFADVNPLGYKCKIARIGYSGEHGYELIAPAANADAIWRRLCSAGETRGLMECGFEAINTLRIEAGHVLFTNELKSAVNPYELGLARLVDSFRQDYLGALALTSMRFRAPARKLVGLLPNVRIGEEKQLVSGNVPSKIPPGEAYMTSLSLSPTLNRFLGLGYVSFEDHYPGTRVKLANRLTAIVARLPYYDPGKILPRRSHLC